MGGSTLQARRARGHRVLSDSPPYDSPLPPGRRGDAGRTGAPGAAGLLRGPTLFFFFLHWKRGPRGLQAEAPKEGCGTTRDRGRTNWTPPLPSPGTRGPPPTPAPSLSKLSARGACVPAEEPGSRASWKQLTSRWPPPGSRPSPGTRSLEQQPKPRRGRPVDPRRRRPAWSRAALLYLHGAGGDAAGAAGRGHFPVEPAGLGHHPARPRPPPCAA